MILTHIGEDTALTARFFAGRRLVDLLGQMSVELIGKRLHVGFPQ